MTESQPPVASRQPSARQLMPAAIERSRGLLLVLAAIGALVVLFVLTGGLAGIGALGGLAVAVPIVLWPLLGLGLTIVANIMWIIAAIAPAGMRVFSAPMVLIALTFGAWFLSVVRYRTPLTFAPHQLPLLAFATIVIASPFTTGAFADSMVGVQKWALIFAVYFLVANLAITRRSVLYVVAVVSGTLTVASILGVIEYLVPGIEDFAGGIVLFGAHLDTESIAGESVKRVTGGLGDANWLSYSLVTSLPLTLFWFRNGATAGVRAMGLVMAGLQCVALTLCFTRSPFAALAIVVLYLLWKRKLPLAPVAAAGAVLLVSAPLWMPQAMIDRFLSVKYLQEGSTPHRRELIVTAFELIRERPLVGFGYHQFGPEFIARNQSEVAQAIAYQSETGGEPIENIKAHNLYLETAVEYGVPGLLALVLVYAMLFRDLRQVEVRAGPRDADLAVLLSAAFLGFLLCGFFGHSAELKIFWVLAGAAAGLRRVVLAPETSNAERTVLASSLPETA